MLNNRKDFGACGDGISDDRLAIQTAIDEAVAHHKSRILFPLNLPEYINLGVLTRLYDMLRHAA